ncbi:DEAD/DEAH box helicase [Microbacterium awajiense]|uniref:DEAD/DEAH box helicase n=1 Tax=Microbacterium awajiense TaxID=415214 RepID=A0ABP7AHJ6_9MICO
MAEPSELHAGLYESLVTSGLQSRLGALSGLDPSFEAVDEADQPHVLARRVYEETVRQLSSIGTEAARLELANRLLREISNSPDAIAAPVEYLQRLSPHLVPGTIGYEDVRPATPLSESALLTNSRGEPNLNSELKAEIDTADQVDLLCAFVKWHGVRLLEAELQRLRRRGASFRIITTTYLGATERAAIDRLAREFGAQIKVQYDSLRTRLHAKAWLFRRRSGFDTSYVGSSNLSRAALLDGVEWNVRLSRIGTPALLEKFQATFDTYWNDTSYEVYDPDHDRDRLDDALAEASGAGRHGRETVSLSGLEVRPYPYQLEMLDALAAERGVHGRHRNLVVAATGTGKTVLAALDYRRLGGSARSLLFVAHRKEILTQAQRTYREVLTDPNFGEIYVAGSRPERWEHVFASVQSLTSYGVENIPPDAFNVVVIDEFHHASAATYRRLLDHLRPKELLGLTATPERADGNDVLGYFDGRIAAELRLWDALGQELLSPFHYFAIADGTDLSRVAWVRGGYDTAQLSELFTGNDARARIVVKELVDKVIDTSGMRALGFCVDVSHADYMTRVFNAANIPALMVSGDGRTGAPRDEALRKLRNREVNVLFSAELFNEGLDVPDVDTVLFLRPTESATIFLQQLGRGLRRTPEKAVLTALDFVGHQRKQFRWDRKLRALTGMTRQALTRQVEHGFPFLPSGSQIVLDRQAQGAILENLKGQVANRWSQLAAELRSYGDLTLEAFLREAGVELADVLKRGQSGRSWTHLRREAGLPTASGAEHESYLLKRVRALVHVDDRERVQEYLALLADDAPAFSDLSARSKLFAEMLFFSLWPDGGGLDSVDNGLRILRSERAVRDELAAAIKLSFDTARHVPSPVLGRLAWMPLRVHARYQREEVLAGLRYASLQRRPNSFREGVLYVADENIDALFVTLKKSTAAFSPSTMYRDYPISERLFHWESQSVTTVASPTGQRYLAGSSDVLLFVREQKENELGTSPYLFLGNAKYVQHVGERPIAITWKLDRPMPSDFFQRAAVAAQ